MGRGGGRGEGEGAIDNGVVNSVSNFKGTFTELTCINIEQARMGQIGDFFY